MNSRTTLVLVSLVSVASSTGCYSTWDLAPQAVWSLDGFRANDTLKIKSRESESLEFTQDTELTFRSADGIEAEMSFRSIDIQGPHFVGKERYSGKELHVNLSRMKSVQARNFLPAQTAVVTIGAIAAGIPLALGAAYLVCCYTGR